jgi:hypothetical protein
MTAQAWPSNAQACLHPAAALLALTSLYQNGDMESFPAAQPGMGAKSPRDCRQGTSVLLQLLLLACAGCCTSATVSASVDSAATVHAVQLGLTNTTPARSLQGEQAARSSWGVHAVLYCSPREL